jgi:hypothetical protein
MSVFSGEFRLLLGDNAETEIHQDAAILHMDSEQNLSNEGDGAT